ncbi:DsbA family oxidoreductase [Sneathiella sp.]|uniref:DsbA family oxidoreductase n=1 Tax=Sneathiella sp. TaxID=1964365 RepID=UPI002FE2A48C
MKIDIISDTVCPWCFIGKRKLEAALAARPDLAVEIAWHPFQLNPEVPEGGADRETFTARKFGSAERAKQIYDNVKIAGQAFDIDFKFDDIKRTPNTLNSHRLIRWAHTAGCQDEVVEILFRRYFLEGEDIGDAEVLVATAREAGMDADLVAELLAKDADKDLIRTEDSRVREMGISGVPFFIIDGRYALSGAQDPDVFHSVFDKIAAEDLAGGAPE